METEQQQPQTESQLKQRLFAQECLRHLEPLIENEHFAWFMETAVAKKTREARDEALDITRSPEDRDRAAHRHDALREISGWPQGVTDSMRKFLKKADAEK